MDRSNLKRRSVPVGRSKLWFLVSAESAEKYCESVNFISDMDLELGLSTLQKVVKGKLKIHASYLTTRKRDEFQAHLQKLFR